MHTISSKNLCTSARQLQTDLSSATNFYCYLEIGTKVWGGTKTGQATCMNVLQSVQTYRDATSRNRSTHCTRRRLAVGAKHQQQFPKDSMILSESNSLIIPLHFCIIHFSSCADLRRRPPRSLSPAAPGTGGAALAQTANDRGSPLLPPKPNPPQQPHPGRSRCFIDCFWLTSFAYIIMDKITH